MVLWEYDGKPRQINKEALASVRILDQAIKKVSEGARPMLSNPGAPNVETTSRNAEHYGPA